MIGHDVIISRSALFLRKKRSWIVVGATNFEQMSFEQKPHGTVKFIILKLGKM